MRSQDPSQVNAAPQQAPAAGQANVAVQESDAEREARRRHELALRNAEIARLNSQIWQQESETKGKLVKDANNSTSEAPSLSLGESALALAGIIIILFFSIKLAAAAAIAFPLLKILGGLSRDYTRGTLSERLINSTNSAHSMLPKPQPFVPDTANVNRGYQPNNGYQSNNGFQANGANVNRNVPANNGTGLNRSNFSSDGTVGGAGGDGSVQSADMRTEDAAQQAGGKNEKTGIPKTRIPGPPVLVVDPDKANHQKVLQLAVEGRQSRMLKAKEAEEAKKAKEMPYVPPAPPLFDGVGYDPDSGDDLTNAANRSGHAANSVYRTDTSLLSTNYMTPRFVGSTRVVPNLTASGRGSPNPNPSNGPAGRGVNSLHRR